MMLKRAVFVAAAAAFLVIRPASACSPVPDYVVPTNFELVQLATAIVVAHPISETSPKDAASSVRFHVDTVIKGNPPTEFETSGRVGKTTPSLPDVLNRPNAEAFAGACNRYTFSLDKPYVVFLKKDADGDFYLTGYPFTRNAEDYFGPASFWMRTINTYLDIQKRFGPMDQLAEMERLRDRTPQAPASAERDALAEDIANHLRSRSPYKPTGYLIATYEALERGETPRYALRPASADAEKSDAQALTALFFGGDMLRPTDTREQQIQFVLDSLINEPHPDAAPLFERLLADPKVSPRNFGAVLRFLSSTRQPARILNLIETRGLAMLPLLPPREMAMLADTMMSAMDGEGFDKGTTLYLADPDAKARWPEMALRLHLLIESNFGRSHVRPMHEDEKVALRPSDYRARPEVTKLLAAAFDEEVEAWAIAELANEARRIAYENDLEKAYPSTLPDPAELPMRALVLAYGDKRDAAMQKAFCQGGVRRELLMKVLGEEGGGLDQQFFERVLVMPKLTDNDRELIVDAIAAALATARHEEQLNGGDHWLGESSSWLELLQLAIRNEKPKDAKPFACPVR